MKVEERLIKYAQYNTASNPDAADDKFPSSDKQWEFARLLQKEMQEIGLQNIVLDDNCYLFGTIPSNVDNDFIPAIGFIAHMDVSSEVDSLNVNPRIIHFDGQDILLNKEKDIWLRPDDFPVLNNYIGHDLIVTDGTTLLGADDKAGIAEIMCMAERLINDDSIKHGRVVIGFTPDEEIGRGADFFDVQRFGAQFAYTVDGAAFGEIDYETFNAISAQVKINGNAIHPGEAKGKMINASLLAMEFNGMLPCAQRPEYTDGYEGFFHLCEMNGNVEKATMNYILRDHDQSALNRRLSTMQSVAAFMNERYGINTVKLNCRMQYQNMAEKVLQHRYVLDIASDAIRDMGVFPVSRPIRGGTDGARLSFMGLVCPNLGTGSHNHHSCREFASIQEMNKCSELLARIAQKAVEINWKK